MNTQSPKKERRPKKRFRKTKITGVVLLLIALAIVFADRAASSAEYPKGDVKMSIIASSPQYKDGKFHNENTWKQPSIKEFAPTMWKFLFGGNQRKPHHTLPAKQVDLTTFNDTGNNRLNVTWIGHSSLMINLDGYKILTDPVFEDRVSFWGPSRLNGSVPVDIRRLPAIDLVVVSHNHYDHLNKPSILLLKDKTQKFAVPLGVGAELEGWGIPRQDIIELDWWSERPFDDHLTVTAVPSQHFSGRSLSDRDKTLWAAWVVEGPHHKIFFGGDSGYFEGFKQIGDKFGPFDMTFLECGAYNEKWHHIHMYPEETVQAHIDLKGKVLHPIHWATFNLSLHSWDEPMVRFSAAATAAGIETATPIVGDTTVYRDYIPTKKWWKTKASHPQK